MVLGANYLDLENAEIKPLQIQNWITEQAVTISQRNERQFSN